MDCRLLARDEKHSRGIRGEPRYSLSPDASLAPDTPSSNRIYPSYSRGNWRANLSSSRILIWNGYEKYISASSVFFRKTKRDSFVSRNIPLRAKETCRKYCPIITVLYSGSLVVISVVILFARLIIELFYLLSILKFKYQQFARRVDYYSSNYDRTIPLVIVVRYSLRSILTIFFYSIIPTSFHSSIVVSFYNNSLRYFILLLLLSYTTRLTIIGSCSLSGRPYLLYYFFSIIFVRSWWI